MIQPSNDDVDMDSDAEKVPSDHEDEDGAPMETDTVDNELENGSSNHREVEPHQQKSFIGRGDAPIQDPNDYQKEFLVIGQPTFIKLNKINVTSSWVDNATLFPAELNADSLADISSVKGLPPKLAQRVTETISKWFPVQMSVLPLLLSSLAEPPVLRPRDVAVAAPTGSGKTLCYVIPTLAAVGERPTGRLTSLVVVPVQTLVHQIVEEYARFNACGARVTALSGAVEFDKELRKLNDNSTSKCNSDIIVTTPGRLMEHLTHPNSTIKLDSLRFLVVDEADRMVTVRAQWLEVVERRSGGLVRATNMMDTLASRKAPRKILLSATLSKDVEELHSWNLHRPCLFKASVTKSTQIAPLEQDHITGTLALPSTIEHVILRVPKAMQPLAVHRELSENPWKRVLVFTNEKESAHRLCILLNKMAPADSYKVENLTADLFGNRRVKVLKRFKAGTSRVLICSDVLSRGVDIMDVDCVINYDLPKSDRLFVHRGGRTGRAGKEGTLLSIVSSDTKYDFYLMLRKNGLWLEGTTERLMTDEDVEPMREQYKEALAELEKTVDKTSNVVKKEEPDEENDGEDGVPKKKQRFDNRKRQPEPRKPYNTYAYPKQAKKFVRKQEGETNKKSVWSNNEKKDY